MFGVWLKGEATELRMLLPFARTATGPFITAEIEERDSRGFQLVQGGKSEMAKRKSRQRLRVSSRGSLQRGPDLYLR